MQNDYIEPFCHMVNSISESFWQCCHGFLCCIHFIFLSTSWMFCLCRWNFDLVLHNLENIGCLSGEFPAVKVPLLGHVSFSAALNHQWRSQTQVWFVLEAHALHHTENAVFGMHDHRFPSEVSVFSLFLFTFPPQNDFIEGKMHSSQPQTCWMCIFCIFLHLFDWFSMLVSLETLGRFPNLMFLNWSRSLNAS